MPKSKASKGGAGVAQKHLHSRISFLYQASNYFNALSESHSHSTKQYNLASEQDESSKRNLAEATYSEKGAENANPSIATPTMPNHLKGSGLSRHMSYQMRAISLKSQIKLTPEVKRTVCKGCESLLVPGQSCTEDVENSSRNGSKPWADVLVVRCNACCMEKRYPTGAKRQTEKTTRSKNIRGAMDTGQPKSFRKGATTTSFSHAKTEI